MGMFSEFFHIAERSAFGRMLRHFALLLREKCFPVCTPVGKEWIPNCRHIRDLKDTMNLRSYHLFRAGSVGKAARVLPVYLILQGIAGLSGYAAPNVSVTSPSANATISQTATLGAKVTGTLAISSVQFQVDGVSLTSSVSTSGSYYTTMWNTSAVADGPHTITTLATDSGGNTAQGSISVTVSNTLQQNRRVQNTSAVTVYGTPSLSGSVVGAESASAVGTTTGGPASDGQNTWWQVAYDNGLSGWTLANSLAVMPVLSIQANAWHPVQPTFVGAPSGGQLYPQGWGNKGTYDPATHRLIFSDRWADSVRGYQSIFADGLYGYDPVLNLFTVLKLNNWYAQPNPSGGYTTTPLPANSTDPTPPDHHPLAALEVVPQQNAVYTVNGVNSISLPDPTILNKTWRFDLAASSWSMVSSYTTDPNYPPNNPSSPGVLYYDPGTNKLVYLVEASCGCQGTITYVFNMATNAWTILPQDPSSLAVNISGSGIAYDSKRGLLVAYGGNIYVNNPTSTLWAYSVATNKWTELSSAPVAAMAPAFAYDGHHDVFLALVGNNTYLYNPNTNSWLQYPATLNRPIDMPNWQGVTYDPAHDVFVFEGGMDSNSLIALFRYDPSWMPTLSVDNNSPSVSVTAPANGATVAGSITVSANATDPSSQASTDNVGIVGVQFQLDGANMAGVTAGSGPSFSIGWNTAQAPNGPHTLTALAIDEVGNTVSASVSVTVNNPLSAPAISNVAVNNITASTAVINWTTNTASSSQIAYGTSSSYGSLSALGSALVTSHSIMLSGLQPSTTYHFEVLSRDSQGNLGTAADFTFATTTQPTFPTLFKIMGNNAELSGTANGSTVAPPISPSNYRGVVVVNGSGSVNFAGSGNGVYFLNCCVSSNNAYYKFTGATTGSIFDISQGQVSFTLTSRYSFAQRQANAATARYAFDVRDGNINNHLFYFLTEVSSGTMMFAYSTGGGPAQFYYVPKGTEDTLFGNGVNLNVALSWNGTTSYLYLNGILAQSTPYTAAVPNWTAASNFDLGAYEYATYGGYNTSDDLISAFTVTGSPGAVDTTPPVVSITAPASGASVSGTVPVSANATDNVAMSSVQFQVGTTNLGTMTGAGPSYAVSWNTSTLSNGSYTLTATAMDTSGNTATASIPVTVSNPTGPVISSVSAESVTSSSAVISWTTNVPASSQVAYGTSTSYGSSTPLNSTPVTSHSVTIAGLNPSTLYDYQVTSQDSQGNVVSSGNLTFTTSAAGVQTLLQIQGNASEVSGTSTGSIVTPGTAPSGFSGTVVANGSGSVNFAGGGNGVYFLNCCVNSNNAYYKFTGATVGNIFNIGQGQVSFTLTSRYSFAQRQANAAAPRYAFDVRDSNVNNHLFYLLTEVSYGYLVFSYRTAGGTAQFYYVPKGTEDTLFGNGVNLNVALSWNGTTSYLYLNGILAQSTPYTAAVPNWTAASNFDLGAYEYATYGGYNTSDDLISEFTVSGAPGVVDTAPPVVSITAPASGASVSGTVPVSANATDNVAMSSVQFQVGTTNLGTMTGAGPSYAVSWNTSTLSNGSYTLTATATDTSGNTATASIPVTISNPTGPVISSVSAGSVTSSSAVISWTTNVPASSQAAYGTSTSYGSSTPLNSTRVTSHSVTIAGLNPSTLYDYQVTSQDSQGNVVSSGNLTFTTSAAGVQTLLQIQGNASEVSGTSTGSIVTPGTAPSGFSGTVAANGSGSVNFAGSGNGVYFLNCCVNSNNAYYKFTGATIGSIFDITQGQVSFTLTSRYSFAQRQANAAAARYAFDVRDGNINNHLFYLVTEVSYGYLVFSYRTAGGPAQFYYVPKGTEDTLFGNGVNLNVALSWNGTTSYLYLNGVLAQSSPYTAAVPNWTPASNFDLGAYEYATYGGYNTSDDLISAFTVGHP